LPKGISPALGAWLEILSNPPEMYHNTQKVPKIEKEIISLGSYSIDKTEGEEEVKCDTDRRDGLIDGEREGEGEGEGEGATDKERERENVEKARAIKTAAESKALKEACKVSELKKQKDSKKDELKATKEEKREREYIIEREHAFLNSISDSHHRITKHITKKSYLSQICCIGSYETQTQVTLWADMRTREVSR
jgi:hypothetical protein